MKKLLAALLLLGLAACSSKHEVSAAAGATIAETHAKPAAPRESRHLAMTHKVALEVDDQKLQDTFAAIRAECLKQGCELLQSVHRTGANGRSPSASLIARVPPAAFDGFLASVQKQGALLSHEAEAEDLTAAVIDVDARIKNLEALRARLSQLLQTKTATLKDTLEVETQLAATQTELDAINGKRRALGQRIEMVRIELELSSPHAYRAASWHAPITSAAKESGAMLSHSVAGLITFTVAVLPWAIALFVLLIPVRRYWRRRKLNAAAAAARN